MSAAVRKRFSFASARVRGVFGHELPPAEWVLAGVALFLVAWLNVGTASEWADDVPGYWRWGLFAIWLSVSGIRERGLLTRLVRALWPLVLLLAYSVLASRFAGANLRAYEYGIAYLAMGYALYLRYSASRFRAVQLLLVGYIACDLAVVSVRTYLALESNPMLSRLLATSAQTQRAVLGTGTFYGVGGYGYAYSLGAVVLLLTYRLLNRRQGRVVVGGLIVAALVMLFKTAFMIAILLTLAGVATLGAIKLASTLGRRFATISVVASAAGVVLLGPLVLRSIAAAFAPSNTTAVRLRELARALSGGNLGGTDLRSRFGLYFDSLAAFAHDPVLGTSADPSSRYAAGGHATWLDILGVYGLASALLFLFLVKAYRSTSAQFGSDGRGGMMVAWAYFLILGIVNTLLFADILLTWFFFIPIAGALLVRTDLAKAGSLSDRLQGGRRDSRLRAERLACGSRTDASAEAIQTEDGAGAKTAKVLLIHHAPGIGGGTRSFQDIIEMLSGTFEVVACAPTGSEYISGWLASKRYKFVPAEMPLPFFNHYNGGSPLVSRTFWLGLARYFQYKSEVSELIRRERPDMVVVNSAVLAPLGGIIRSTGAKSVCLVRETFPGRTRSLRTRVLYGLLDRTFDGVVFLCEADRRRAALRRAATCVVRDAVKVPPVAASPRADACGTLGVSVDTFNVLYVGGLSRIKGLDVLLAALASIPAPDLRLVVAGNMDRSLPRRPEKRPLRRFAVGREGRFERKVAVLMERPAIASRMVVAGMQADMAACYSSADVVVFPATVPHQARPVFEAGAYRVPAVISRYPETEALVLEGVTGLGFRAGDSTDLAAQILRLYEDRSLCRALGAANHGKTIEDHAFAVERVHLIEFVQSVLAGKP